MTQAAPPDVEYAGKVRAHDPDESWDAAAQQTRDRTSLLQDRLLAILRDHGALTDDELFDRYQGRAWVNGWRHATPQSVRSRRSELHHMGLVTRTGDRRPSAHGGKSAVWKATS